MSVSICTYVQIQNIYLVPTCYVAGAACAAATSSCGTSRRTCATRFTSSWAASSAHRCPRSAPWPRWSTRRSPTSPPTPPIQRHACSSVSSVVLLVDFRFGDNGENTVTNCFASDAALWRCEYSQETKAALAEMAYKASLLENEFNKLEGFRCNVVQGAMYAFPQIRLPERFIRQAKVRSLNTTVSVRVPLLLRALTMHSVRVIRWLTMHSYICWLVFVARVIYGSHRAAKRSIYVSSNCTMCVQAEGQEPDVKYCFRMLEETGICVVPGSGFGQAEGTFHFRFDCVIDLRVHTKEWKWKRDALKFRSYKPMI